MSSAAWRDEASGDGPVATDQLERHGFVHCCTREQILEIAAWWLRDESPLVAVAVDVDRAGDVRFERADLGREYPHVYNALPREAVLAACNLPDTDPPSLPAELASPPPAFLVNGVRDGDTASAVWCDGRLVSGSRSLRADADALVERGEEIPQFPGVKTVASLATPYAAFCVLAALLDEIESYRGDGFFEMPEDDR
jgi:uncharacterized protein (DUF952 family)